VEVVTLLLGLLLVGWVAQDASRRNRTWPAWALFVYILGPLGWAIWLFARRRTPKTLEPLPRARQVTLWLSGGLLHLPATAAALLVTNFLFQSALMEGSSMSPTLGDQQRVFVNKLAYRTNDPEQGDVVMFHYPRDPDKLFVKRIIARGGDSVHIIDGHVSVNGMPLEETYVVADARSAETHGPELVKEAHYFVMGDRRNNSADSRHWGQVPELYIVGRVIMRGGLGLFDRP